MGETSIEWTDATWNPTRGCSRVSEGCRNCYAERMAARFSGPGKPFHGFADPSRSRMLKPPGHWTGRVELIPSKLDEPLHWRKPRRVFVNSMSDLFHEALPDEAIGRVFAVMGGAEHHTFQILTKRPERMLKFMMKQQEAWSRLGPLDPLPNVWLGVSCEDQKMADERIPLLLQTPAAVRFVSLEPLLGDVDLATGLSGNPVQTRAREYVSHEMALDAGEPSMEGSLYSEEEWEQTTPRLDWVIVGGESGPGARPFYLGLARSVRDQCRAAKVPFFFKQSGSNPTWGTGDATAEEDRRFIATRKSAKGGDPAEWPEDLRVREFPR